MLASFLLNYFLVAFNISTGIHHYGCRYGRCFRLSIFDTDYIVVSDPDLIEEITSRSDQFAKLVDKDPVFRALRVLSLLFLCTTHSHTHNVAL